MPALALPTPHRRGWPGAGLCPPVDLHARGHAVALQALIRAGWSLRGIVTLAQLIAFVSFQSRLVSGCAA
jgi:hypothetical protein